MAVYLENESFHNAAKLWNKYSEEEEAHAKKAEEFLMSFKIKPELRVLAAQPVSYEGFPDIIQKTYDHEIDITEQCNTLAEKALKEGNMMVFSLAQWYVSEQIEELSKVSTLQDLLEGYGPTALGLRLLDHELENY